MVRGICTRQAGSRASGDDMTIRKAMIIIAVSDYEEQYRSLPGTRNCAARLQAWAECRDDDRSYTVLAITDALFPVTRGRLESEIGQFLGNRIVDRLVVWFAGHGSVTGSGQEYWLLSGIHNDVTAAVDVLRFTRALQTVNIGGNSQVLESGQLIILSDCCRTMNLQPEGICGTPVILGRGRYKQLQMDRFISTALGERSYHTLSNGAPSCLFSDCLLEALSGEVEEAILRQYHRDSPAVVNHSLASYLKAEVPKRAARHNEDMTPDTTPGIHPPENVYLRIADTVMAGRAAPDVGARSAPQPSSVASDPPEVGYDLGSTDTAAGGWRDDPAADSIDAISASMYIDSLKYAPDLGFLIFKERDPTFATGLDDAWRFLGRHLQDFGFADQTTLCVLCDFEPDAIAIPASDGIMLRHKQSYVELHAKRDTGDAIAVRHDGIWILVPHFPGKVSVLLRDNARDVLFYDLKTQGWDLTMCDTMNITRRRLPVPGDVGAFEAAVQDQEPEQGFLPALTAAYLSAFANDYTRVARLAHFLADRSHNGIPFDVALLCASRVDWRMVDGRWKAYAELPTVKSPGPETVEGLGDANYARRRVLLWGVTPVFATGWRLLSDLSLSGAPDALSQLHEFMAGRTAPSIPIECTAQLKEALPFYQIIPVSEIRERDGQPPLAGNETGGNTGGLADEGHFDSWDQ